MSSACASRTPMVMRSVFQGAVASIGVDRGGGAWWALAVFPERSQVSIRAERRELGQRTGNSSG